MNEAKIGVSFDTKDLLKSAITIGFGIAVGKFAAEVATSFVKRKTAKTKSFESDRKD